MRPKGILINRQRAAAGVPTLTMASDVSHVGRQYSQDMAQPGYKISRAMCSGSQAAASAFTSIPMG